MPSEPVVDRNGEIVEEGGDGRGRPRDGAAPDGGLHAGRVSVAASNGRIRPDCVNLRGPGGGDFDLDTAIVTAGAGTLSERQQPCGCRGVPEGVHIAGCTELETPVPVARKCRVCGFRGATVQGHCGICGARRG